MFPYKNIILSEVTISDHFFKLIHFISRLYIRNIKAERGELSMQISNRNGDTWGNNRMVSTNKNINFIILSLFTYIGLITFSLHKVLIVILKYWV